jgi:hypothetical protein
MHNAGLLQVTHVDTWRRALRRCLETYGSPISSAVLIVITHAHETSASHHIQQSERLTDLLLLLSNAARCRL